MLLALLLGRSSPTPCATRTQGYRLEAIVCVYIRAAAADTYACRYDHEAEREPWWRQDSRYSEVQRKNRRTVFMHDDWLKHRSSNRFFRNIRTIGSPASSECPSSQRPCDHPPPRRPSRHLLVLRAALWVWEESLGANKRLWRHCVACPKSANSLPFTV